MSKQLAEKAKELIEKIIYINLATTHNNIPWNTPLVATYDAEYNFYWRSAKEAIHSINIKENGKVFITIFDTHKQNWKLREAVYIQATARELVNEEEINQILPLLDKRAGTSFGNATNFLNASPRRVYKAIPEKVWINVDEEIDGQFVDKRVEIKLS